MSALSDRQWFMMAVLLYGVSTVYSVFVWRRGFQRDDRINYLLIFAGGVLHTMAMIQRGFTINRCPVNNLFEAMMFINWSIVVTYVILGLLPRIRFVAAFASPIILFLGLYALMPGLDHRDPEEAFTKNAFVSLHAVMILVSYGAFGLSAVASAMYLTQEKNLKQHQLQAVFSLLPPIQRLEKVGRHLLAAGWILLTLGLALVPMIMPGHEGVRFYQDAKILWSLLVWSAYTLLHVLRWKYHFGGRSMAWWIIGIFVFVILTFTGTNLMSELHQ